MQRQPTLCTECFRTGRHLAASSENSLVDYYRCDHCGHVWAIDKRQHTSRDVTVAVTKGNKAG
jgi:uncharacterized Zn finger protein